MSENEKGMEVTLGDRKFYIKPPKDFRDIEDRIVKRRKSPLDIVCAKLDRIPEEHRKAMLYRALDLEPKFEDYVTEEEFAQYLDTRDGVSFYWWLMIRENHPDVKLEEVDGLFKKMTDEQFQLALQRRNEVLAENPPPVPESA